MALVNSFVGGSRGYVAGKYAIELDGINAGWVWSVEGGNASSEVVVEKMSVQHAQHKHISGVKYEDISITCGTGMSQAFYQWIQNTLDYQHTRKNGSVISANYDQIEMSRMTFYNALLTEFGMPALDGSAKDAAKMTVKFAPEFTRTKIGQGAKLTGFKTDPNIQKKWLTSNFRIRIDGIPDDVLQRVNKIEALTVKQKVVEHALGETRDYQKEGGGIEFPHLVFTLAENAADDFYKWHESFVIKGESHENSEKNGSIVYLTNDLKTPLYTLNFFHMGIFKLTPDKVEAGNEQIRRIKIELYVEEIKFKFESGSTWT